MSYRNYKLCYVEYLLSDHFILYFTSDFKRFNKIYRDFSIHGVSKIVIPLDSTTFKICVEDRKEIIHMPYGHFSINQVNSKEVYWLINETNHKVICAKEKFSSVLSKLLKWGLEVFYPQIFINK